MTDEELTLVTTEWYRGEADRGEFSLNRIQARVLARLAVLLDRGGVLEQEFPVGAGKTTCSILAPLAVGWCGRAALFVQPTLYEVCRRKFAQLIGHARLPNTSFTNGAFFAPGSDRLLHVLPRTWLSAPDGQRLLETIDPDLIIIDSDHPRTVRATRVREFHESRGSVGILRWKTVVS